MPVILVNAALDELTDLLRQLDNDQYSAPCVQLSGSTIGEHTRHIIEMLQCLINSYDSGFVDYDVRQRNKLLETNTSAAIATISETQNSLLKDNCDLKLIQNISGEALSVKTSYFRELIYNLEHCIHHQALIKVAVMQYNVNISPSFGVARSTILYRNQCAQ